MSQTKFSVGTMFDWNNDEHDRMGRHNHSVTTTAIAVLFNAIIRPLAARWAR
jgi:hypothetical protein